jgi:hypothetical protein
MTWKAIRLELARTPDFPEGSPGRAYLLRLPLEDNGIINECAVQIDPGHATVRRYWPSQPDMSGQIVHTPRGWAFSYPVGEERGDTMFHLENRPLRPGEFVTLTEPDGRRLPFRVACVRELT